jgi:hypothetical protein
LTDDVLSVWRIVKQELSIVIIMYDNRIGVTDNQTRVILLR